MRDHLNQAGVRLNAAETQLRASMNAGGYVKFTLGKEMMPDNFSERWRLRAHGRCLGVDHAATGRRARGQVRRDCTAAGMGRTSKRQHEVCEVLVHGTRQSYRRNAASTGEKRTTQRWSERLEATAYGVRASDQCDSTWIHEEIIGNPSSENTSEVGSAIQCEDTTQEGPAHDPSPSTFSQRDYLQLPTTPLSFASQSTHHFSTGFS